VEGLCNVVVWGQPSQPNGQVTGFNAQVYIPGVWYGTETFIDNNFYRVRDSDIDGRQRSEIYVGVSELHNVISMHTCQAQIYVLS